MDQTQLAKKIESLQRELVSTSQKINELESLEKQIQLLQTSLTEIQEHLAQFPETQAFIQRQLQEKQIYPWFYNLRKKVQASQTQFNQLNDDLLTKTIFLENNRTYRHYQFTQMLDLAGFLEEIAFIYDVKTYAFQPNYMGVVDLTPLEQNQIISKTSSQSWSVEPQHVKHIFAYLNEKKTASSFKLEATDLRILIKNTQTLKIEAQNPVIRRLDLAAKTKNGKPLDD